MYLTLLFSQPQ